MGEFWLNSPTHDKPNDMLDAISGAHIYGKNIIQAEGFTEVRGTWDEHPGMLKALLDRNYALGINRLFFHVYVHNPWLDRKPGMTLDGIGLFFQRELGNQFGNVVFHQKVILLLSTSCGWGARAGGGCSGSGNVPDTPFRPRCLRGVPKWTHTPIFCIIIHHFAREKIAFLLKNVKSENFFCAGCWCVWHCISPLFRVKFKIRIYSGKNVFWLYSREEK